MKVAGGVYREECVRPHWSRIFGSGGRAAAAVSLLSPNSTLAAYACTDWADDIRYSMAAFGVATEIREIEEDIAFHYLHPLSRTELVGAPIQALPSLTVEGDVVLRFGFVEGDAVVAARRAIYDPQNASEVLRFYENGSSAGTLALVLNEIELERSVGMGGTDGARRLISRSRADVVVIKMGPHGALVVTGSRERHIPAYPSDSVFKIGSGDVFSAVFAHFWGEMERDAGDAADLASRAVARYVQTRNVQVELEALGAFEREPAASSSSKIYIAAPFFTLPQRWLVEEMRRCLHLLGADSFSPIHDVGSHGGPRFIAGADLAGLESCGAVLAVADGDDAGTLFEVGYARKLGIPVVVLAESPRPESLTMLAGTGCRVTSDFSSAIYNAVWAAAL